MLYCTTHSAELFEKEDNALFSRTLEKANRPFKPTLYQKITIYG